MQQDLNAVRRARQESRPALQEHAGVLGMKRIDILGRRDGVQHFLLGNVRRERQLHQDAVHGGSALSCAIRASNSSCGVSAGNRTSSLSMPAFLQARCLLRT